MNDTTAQLTRVAPTPPTVSTITCTGRLNRTHVPVEAMQLAVEVAEVLGVDSLAGFRLDTCDAKKGRHATKRFCAQLPLRRNGKSLKVFQNGSLHATGCSCPLEFLEMADALRDFFAQTLSWDPDSVRLVSFDVQLINSLFSITRPGDGRPLTVAPAALRNKLWADHHLTADFDTERHPSVKIPIMEGDTKVATVCVFQTGSVTIMGAKRPRFVAAAFRQVCTVLDAAADAVCRPDPGCAMRTTTARQPMALSDGYPFNLHACCMGTDPTR